MEQKYIPKVCLPRKNKEGIEEPAKYAGEVLIDLPDFVKLANMQIECGAIDMADLHEEGKKITAKVSYPTLVKMADMVRPHIKAAKIQFLPKKKMLEFGSNEKVADLYGDPDFAPVVLDIAGHFLAGATEGN